MYPQACGPGYLKLSNSYLDMASKWVPYFRCQFTDMLSRRAEVQCIVSGSTPACTPSMLTSLNASFMALHLLLDALRTRLTYG